MKRIEYYSATWCGPCMTFKPVMKELKDEGMNIKFIDIEEEQQLAQENNIRSIPVTIIYGDDDKEITRLIGVQTKEAIKYWMA